MVLSRKYDIVLNSINVSSEPYVVSDLFYVALSTVVDVKHSISNTVRTIDCLFHPPGVALSHLVAFPIKCDSQLLSVTKTNRYNVD